MLERLEAAKILPANQDPERQKAIARVSKILLKANVVDPGPKIIDIFSPDHEQKEKVIHHYAFTFYPQIGRVVMKKDRRQEWLNDAEKRMLILFQKRGVVASHKDICMNVWGKNESDCGSAEKKCIERLRRKLEPDIKGREKYKIIITVNGIGYALNTGPDSVSNQKIYHSGFTYDPEEKVALLANGKQENLTEKEDAILLKLSETPGKVVSNQILKDALDGLVSNPTDELLKKCVFNLRRKVEPDGKRGDFRYIVYKQGIGYMLDDPENTKIQRAAEVYAHKRFTWNRTYSKITPVGGETSTLTPVESILLGIFVREPDKNLSTENLGERIESDDRIKNKFKQISRENIKWHISQLRKKLEQDPKNPESIITIRESGEYVFRSKDVDDRNERLSA